MHQQKNSNLHLLNPAPRKLILQYVTSAKMDQISLVTRINQKIHSSPKLWKIVESIKQITQNHWYSNYHQKIIPSLLLRVSWVNHMMMDLYRSYQWMKRNVS
jgi:hypothetical protein